MLRLVSWRSSLRDLKSLAARCVLRVGCLPRLGQGACLGHPPGLPLVTNADNQLPFALQLGKRRASTPSLLVPLPIMQLPRQKRGWRRHPSRKMVVAANHVPDLTAHGHGISASSPESLSRRDRDKTASTAFLHLPHMVALHYRAVPATNSRATSCRASSTVRVSLAIARSNKAVDRPTSRRGADPSSMPPPYSVLHEPPASSARPRHLGVRLVPLPPSPPRCVRDPFLVRPVTHPHWIISQCLISGSSSISAPAAA